MWSARWARLAEILSSVRSEEALSTSMRPICLIPILEKL